MNCPGCGKAVAAHWSRCDMCKAVLGFPNVRSAGLTAEVKHLEERYRAAYDDAKLRGAEVILRMFEEQIVSHSRAVICRALGTLNHFVQSGHGPFQTFYQQVTRNRIPEDNQFDRVRGAVDFLFFPYYAERVHFAALTLDKNGPTSYGANQPTCHLVLRNETIGSRASLFQENSTQYCIRTKHRITDPLPLGSRARWEQRHMLAVAKCGCEISMATQPADFARILMRSGDESGTDVFIEVHIHEPLTAEDVEEVLLPRPQTGADQTLLAVLSEYFCAAGATCREVV